MEFTLSPIVFPYFFNNYYFPINCYPIVPTFPLEDQQYPLIQDLDTEQKNTTFSDKIKNQGPRALRKRKSIRKKLKKAHQNSNITSKHRRQHISKQRQQTSNRNLNSNTLKVFVKQVRDLKTETSTNIQKLIQVNQINLTHQRFLRKLNHLFPISATYLSLDSLKQKMSLCYEDQEQRNFQRVLRWSLKRFFSYEIFTVNIKSARTTRKIRNLQIKRGKQIIRQLSI